MDNTKVNKRKVYSVLRGAALHEDIHDIQATWDYIENQLGRHEARVLAEKIQGVFWPNYLTGTYQEILDLRVYGFLLASEMTLTGDL